MSSDARVAFSVVADWSGRKFKMMLEEKDIASMKVEKIKRTLAKFTSLSPDDFFLVTAEGQPLEVGMKGVDFGLHAGMVLRMSKKEKRGPSLGRMTPPPPPKLDEPSGEEPLPPGTSGSPSLAHNQSAPRDARSVSPLRSLPPALKDLPVNQSTPRPPSSPLRLGLNTEQIKLQQKLILEAQQAASSQVPNITDLLRKPASPGISNIDSVLDGGPNLNTPAPPKQQVSPSPDPSMLEKRIQELRAENEALRKEKQQQQHLSGVQQHPGHRSLSPVVDRWLRTGGGQHQQQPPQPPSFVRERPPAPPTLSSQQPPSPAPPLQQQQHHSGGDLEMRQIIQKCNELARHQHTLEAELEVMKQEWGEERRQRMSSWEEEHYAWTKRQQQLVSDWERDKQLLLSKLVDPNTLSRICQKWECENSSHSPVGVGESRGWEEERSQLVQSIEQLTRQREEAEEKEVEEEMQRLENLQAKKQGLQQETQKLKKDLSRSRHDTEQNKLFVIAASQSLEELQANVIATTGVTSEASKSVVHTTTEKAMLAERVHTLRIQHDDLSQTLQKEMALRKHLHNTLEDIKGSIRAIVRMRPLLPYDQILLDEEGAPIEKGTVTVADTSSVTVNTPTLGLKEYHFYRALQPESTQADVFEEIRPLLQSTLDGYNVCVMAYGQTGSGKTYTIMGEQAPDKRGVLPRAVQELFRILERVGCEYELRCSMVELYLDNLRDLLSPDHKKCEMHQLPSGLQISCSDHVVTTPNETLALLKHGTGQRQVHSTLMNPQSSRSHAVFTMMIRLRANKTESLAKLSFVDLAGSERVKVSHSKGDRLKEAQMINKSLSALGDVVAALSAKSKPAFVPYRNSKLTMILQEALGGNSKTVLFACICPGGYGASNISETVSTLGFASRVKHVHNPYLRNITKVQNDAIVSSQQLEEEYSDGRNRGL